MLAFLQALPLLQDRRRRAQLRAIGAQRCVPVVGSVFCSDKISAAAEHQRNMKKSCGLLAAAFCCSDMRFGRSAAAAAAAAAARAVAIEAVAGHAAVRLLHELLEPVFKRSVPCLLYTSDAADD